MAEIELIQHQAGEQNRQPHEISSVHALWRCATQKSLMCPLHVTSGAPEMPIASWSHAGTEVGILDTPPERLVKLWETQGMLGIPFGSGTLPENLVIIESYNTISCIINIIIYYL